jgi:DNA-binding SARP family transcriptional activator/tetratricopeptide (TPR) repeat protein
VITGQGAADPRFEILGPLRAWRGGREVELGPMRQRIVLAALLLHANRPIGRESLIEAVWAVPPAYAVNLLQKHVSALRRTLEPPGGARTEAPTVTWTGSGYLLAVADGALDLAEFDREAGRGRAAAVAGDAATAAAALHAAVRLWRGPPFDGLASPLLDAERDRLAERYLAVLEDRIDAELGLAVGGPGHPVLAELRGLVADHPLRERPVGLLMLALHRAGRRAEAVGAYEAARRRLGDDLGLEPGPALAALHREILTAGNGSTGNGSSGNGSSGNGSTGNGSTGNGSRTRGDAPLQLPHAIPHFAGRSAELRRLDALVGEEPARGVVVTTLTGAAGIGKTALAVHWARRSRHRFPDGQLYVDLRGFGPTGPAVEPDEAIRGFLNAFGVPPKEIPEGLDARACLYRSLLADRRVLVVLDNARDADHVRPLLPGAPGCLVLVTSRDRLLSLVAAEAAHPVQVDLLPPEEAHELLARRLGEDRVAAEPDAVAEIVRRCSRLPLALAIVAARAAAHPGFPLAALADELRGTRGGLDAFEGGDGVTDVRAIFSWSYRRLDGPAARLFRLLGLHPGPDIGAPAAASLADLPADRVRPLLAELTRAHLIEERAPGRYAFHDLLRAYAVEQAQAQDDEADRRAAQRRCLDHYVHTGHRAALALHPHRDPQALAAPAPGVTPEPIDGHAAARAWFADERRVLLSLVTHAERLGHDADVWLFAWVMLEFLYFQGHWRDQAATQRAALDAARRLGDRTREAHARRGLAGAYMWLGRHDEATAQYRRALALFDELGDRAGAAYTHRSMAWVLVRQGRHAEALERARLALALYRRAGHPSGEAHALNQVGWYHAQLGALGPALDHCEPALALHTRMGNRYGMAQAADSLGYTYHRLGELDRAVTYFVRAGELWRELAHGYGEGLTLMRLGDVLAARGEPAAARDHWERALAIIDGFAPADADEIRARLRADPYTGSRPGPRVASASASI